MRQPTRHTTTPALRIALVYAAISLVWKYLSDRFLLAMGWGAQAITALESEKGFAFIIVSALLLYALIRRSEAHRDELLTRHQALLRMANDVVLLIDSSWRIVEANERVLDLYGYRREQLIGQPFNILSGSAAVGAPAKEFARADYEDGLIFEAVHRDLSGTEIPVEVSARPILIEGITYHQAIIRDQRERKAAEQRIHRLSGLYRALSEVNQAILHETDERALFDAVSANAVNFGDMIMAWIGLVNTDLQRIDPVSSAGDGSEILTHLGLTLDADTPIGRSPSATAVRTAKAVIVDDYLTEPSTAPWVDIARKWGWRSMGAFPIHRSTGVYAVLAVYSGAPAAFDSELTALLQEMADDVSFALNALDARKAREQMQAELSASEARHRAIFAASPIPIWIYDPETLRFVHVNEAAIRKYGYSREEFMSMLVTDIRPATEIPRFLDYVHEHVSTNLDPTDAGIWQHTCRNGDLIWAEITSQTIHLDGRVMCLVIARDVTARLEREARQRLASKVFESSHDGMVICDLNGGIVAANPAFTRITGYTLDEVLGSNPSILKSGRQDPDFYAAMWSDLIQHGYWEGEVWNRRKTGEVYPEHLSITSVRDNEDRVTHYVGAMSDLTAFKASEDRARYQELHDALTGLPNLLLFEDRARQAIATAERLKQGLAVFHLDIDRFKNVNESLGHAAGDQILCEIAKRLSNRIHMDDTLCRRSGDEFIALLLNTDGPGAAHVAQRAQKIINEPLSIDGQMLSLSASVGVALYPENGDTIARLLQCADAALSRAKTQLSGLQFFEQRMQDQISEQLVIESDLRQALQEQEFVLHYQPQVEAGSGRIVGAEALIRWQHPSWGLVAPSRFIPVAEETGLIREIGDWVMREAVRQNTEWRDQGLPIVPVAVNLSQLQFNDPGLFDVVVRTLNEANLPPAMLELELTESIAMGNSEFILDQVRRFRELGTPMSIDDFGTGYSSLSYLKLFSVDKLKIDQSFVRALGTDDSSNAIVLAIISLARNLGFRTIAEGVETPAQHAFLHAHGCDEIQGYLFSRPIAAEAFAKILLQATLTMDL